MFSILWVWLALRRLILHWLIFRLVCLIAYLHLFKNFTIQFFISLFNFVGFFLMFFEHFHLLDSLFLENIQTLNSLHSCYIMKLFNWNIHFIEDFILFYSDVQISFWHTCHTKIKENSIFSKCDYSYWIVE